MFESIDEEGRRDSIFGLFNTTLSQHIQADAYFKIARDKASFMCIDDQRPNR
jgi:hypothetical protein